MAVTYTTPGCCCTTGTGGTGSPVETACCYDPDTLLPIPLPFTLCVFIELLSPGSLACSAYESLSGTITYQGEVAGVGHVWLSTRLSTCSAFFGPTNIRLAFTCRDVPTPFSPPDFSILLTESLSPSRCALIGPISYSQCNPLIAILEGTMGNYLDCCCPNAQIRVTVYECFEGTSTSSSSSSSSGS